MTLFPLICQEILSNRNELGLWKLNAALPSDTNSIRSALILREMADSQKIQWPLLIDPDNQAEKWIRTFHRSRSGARLEEESGIGVTMLFLSAFFLAVCVSLASTHDELFDFLWGCSICPL